MKSERSGKFGKRKQKALIFVILFATLAFVSVGCVSATTHYVDPCQSIQAAVDRAHPGDIIIVRDGTYTENIDVNKSLTIQSENGSASTIVPTANLDDHVFNELTSITNSQNLSEKSAKIWHVDDDLRDYPTADFTRVQVAVDASSRGDTIIVHPGIYHEMDFINRPDRKVIIYEGAVLRTRGGLLCERSCLILRGTWFFKDGYQIHLEEGATVVMEGGCIIKTKSPFLIVHEAKTDKDTYSQNEFVEITSVVLNENGTRVSADVTAEIERPDGSKEMVSLSETGIGNYEGNFTNTALNGTYCVAIRAEKEGYVGHTVWLRFEVKPVPVLLVHGWRPAQDPPGTVSTWERLIGELDKQGIKPYEFTYLPTTDDPKKYAAQFKQWIEQLRNDTGYTGKFDIVCHSMGAMVTRYYMEKLDGAENVRQWIGIAPVNNGAAIADLVGTPLTFLNTLLFFFPGYIPGSEPAVQAMMIKSSTLAELNYDIGKFNQDIWGNPQHLASGVTYRNIMGINYEDYEEDGEVKKHPADNPSFSPKSAGKTRVFKKDSEGELYPYGTRQGDGVVAMEQSILKGSNVGNEVFYGVNHNNKGVNHNTILNNPDVIARVIEYLKNSSLPPANLPNWLTPDPDDDHEYTGIGNQGYLTKDGSPTPIEFLVDSSVEKATVALGWQGSELDLTLTSPSGVVMEPGVYPVVEYYKGDISIWYVIDSPELGVWTALLDPIDVPDEGEPYTFATFLLDTACS